MKNVLSQYLRRPREYTSSLIVNNLILRHPLVVAWWSAALPGFGHIILCKYFTGFLFMSLELLINVKANLNTAIFYSMIGQFAKAKEICDTRWILLYAFIYVFAIRDCYRITVNINYFYLIASKSDAPILPAKISALELNFLTTHNLRDVVIWSAICPGLGNIYVNRMPSGFFLLVWFILTFYKSHLSQAILATFYGEFHLAKIIFDPEWALFLPSIYGYSMYSAYLHAFNLSDMFKIEQSRFLLANYQDSSVCVSTTMKKVK